MARAKKTSTFRSWAKLGVAPYQVHLPVRDVHSEDSAYFTRMCYKHVLSSYRSNLDLAGTCFSLFAPSPTKGHATTTIKANMLLPSDVLAELYRQGPEAWCLLVKQCLACLLPFDVFLCLVICGVLEKNCKDVFRPSVLGEKGEVGIAEYWQHMLA